MRVFRPKNRIPTVLPFHLFCRLDSLSGVQRSTLHRPRLPIPCAFLVRFVRSRDGKHRPQRRHRKHRDAESSHRTGQARTAQSEGASLRPRPKGRVGIKAPPGSGGPRAWEERELEELEERTRQTEEWTCEVDVTCAAGSGILELGGILRNLEHSESGVIMSPC